ncbi:MAG: tRNA pseudouridine(55) synthase TruB [Dehalococcoidia bacterium]
MPGLQRESLDGLIVLDKPAGWTSHDAVARVRRLTGERRVGHAGTLDPLATGVLVLGIGQGTRLLEYVAMAGKSYRATIRLGISTDTYDSDGQITSTLPFESITETGLAATLRQFQGAIEQRPPIYSALKRNGRPLYSYARMGIAIEVQPRLVQIDALRLSRFEPPELELIIECGSGFYVRSLAHDLGQTLGCGAHLIGLVRTRVGRFVLQEAVDLDTVAEISSAGRVDLLLHALDAPLVDQPAVILSAAHVADIVNGKMLHLQPARSHAVEQFCRAYSVAGEFIAVLVATAQGTFQPHKVFPAGHRGSTNGPEIPPIVLSPQK